MVPLLPPSTTWVPPFLSFSLNPLHYGGNLVGGAGGGGVGLCDGGSNKPETLGPESVEGGNGGTHE